MTRYIAFLRAINITGHYVKMEDVRQIFESMDLSNVQTYIQSGNVLFDSSDIQVDELERRIEDRLHSGLGYPVATFLRSDTELIEIAGYRPFQSSELEHDSVLYIAFLHAAPSQELQARLLACSNEIDRLHVYEREVFWLLRRDLGKTSFSNAKIEKILRTPATVRNITTVRKIVTKYLSNGAAT
jgi:uncharacterized protein (DUF1697 family)